MTIDEVRNLAAALNAAADAAQARGETSLKLVDVLRAEDDRATAELFAAIKRASPD